MQCSGLLEVHQTGEAVYCRLGFEYGIRHRKKTEDGQVSCVIPVLGWDRFLCIKKVKWQN